MKRQRLLRISLVILLAGGIIPAGLAASEPITPPIATAWMYMSDDQHYNVIPESWHEIDFKNVDVLNVGPAGVQADGTFGLYSSTRTGDLATRFKWIIQTARAQNPNIKIMVSQWWGDGSDIWGSALSALNSTDVQNYAKSVHDFLASYLGTAGGVDGYDIDYEANNVSANITDITKAIRAQLADLSKANGGRPFYQTVSPATTQYLQDSVKFLDFVNMQTYAGGSGLTPQDFLELGLTSMQLLYGICPETDCSSPSVDQAESAYTDNELAGIHLWRLNSDNYGYEGTVQKDIHDFLHGSE